MSISAQHDSPGQLVMYIDDINQGRLLMQPFAGRVIIQEYETARIVAKAEEEQTLWARRFVLWSDASAGKGYAVTWLQRNSNEHWRHSVASLTSCINNSHCELLGLVEATRVALGMCQERENIIERVVIYSDSQDALKVVEGFHKWSPARQDRFHLQLQLLHLKEYVSKLKEMKVLVELRWVPAHDDIQIGGNQRADRLAREAARHGNGRAQTPDLAAFKNLSRPLPALLKGSATSPATKQAKGRRRKTSRKEAGLRTKADKISKEKTSRKTKEGLKKHIGAAFDRRMPKGGCVETAIASMNSKTTSK